VDRTQVISTDLKSSHTAGPPVLPNAVFTSQHLETLSRLLFQGHSGDFQEPADDLDIIQSDLEYISRLNDTGWSNFAQIANKHHVLVRGLQVAKKAAQKLGDYKVVDRSEASLSAARTRIAHATAVLAEVCKALENAGCPVCVIKSLDHWPDLGSDLDLYTSAGESAVVRVFVDNLKAKVEARSWGDRLANKWNFCLPGLPELIEIHVRYLGQTGEHSTLARRVIARRVTTEVNGHTFWTAAAEERVLISTLQRMYRHFYFRLCDMVDTDSLLRSGGLDFGELRGAAESAGVWPGVATFLLLVQEYAKGYRSYAEIPQDVRQSAFSQDIRVQVRGDFLRVPLLPAASLYGSQLLSAGRHHDFRAMCRLPLLPPLAMTALMAYHLTGSDKGIW
jgi:hypothetical protein